MDPAEVRLERLEAGQERIEARLADLRRHMGVLVEQLRDDIRALAPDFAPIRRELRAGDDAVRDELRPRVDAVELTVRSHSADITKLKRRRR